MSRQAQLPPRCPLQKKSTAHQANGSLCPPSCKDIELHLGQSGPQRSISESSIFDEQPAWLNDLLSDSDSNSNLTLHRRTASDSLTFFDGLMPLRDLDQLNETENADSCEPDDGLGSSCSYGPNSPRSKNNLGLPGKEIVSAFSEYVMHNPMQLLDGYISVSGVLQSDSSGDASRTVGEINNENKPMKRHPGQRSRARKLQYIAELEKTVNMLQNMGSELAVRVASLVQQHAALSMENSTLKQQLLRMQQEKFIVDGEHQSLKKEVERLKTGLAISHNNKAHNRSRSASNLARPDDIWNMLDMRKLDLN
ncbi:hypothetical protein CDL12_08795 [Handroanthus impetiginosus]|uniref:BZIP domain-containing protein n=1 Tax=Handroanthus impetiginosus TaxID=429701 RepID=A0A2G9HM73_9LAMI|nr:hypothetical protein CDL12_08795 [Handroanthus impetiginosus]